MSLVLQGKTRFPFPLVPPERIRVSSLREGLNGTKSNEELAALHSVKSGHPGLKVREKKRTYLHCESAQTTQILPPK